MKRIEKNRILRGRLCLRRNRVLGTNSTPKSVEIALFLPSNPREPPRKAKCIFCWKVLRTLAVEESTNGGNGSEQEWIKLIAHQLVQLEIRAWYARERSETIEKRILSRSSTTSNPAIQSRFHKDTLRNFRFTFYSQKVSFLTTLLISAVPTSDKNKTCTRVICVRTNGTNLLSTVFKPLADI